MLAFDRKGTGSPLVLLHGTNSDRHIWDPILPRLAEERDVIAVDLPAHGESPPSSFSPPAFAQTRRLRFQGGDAIPPSVPVRVVWGERDRIALARRSRFPDELPAHAGVETWEGCGHMVMWDCRDKTVAAALATCA